MKEIVKIYNTVKIGQEVVNTVNARDLHKALESKQDFSTWIKARIQKLGLVENQDFLLHKIMEQPNKGLSGSGLNRIDYYVTIEIAKHIAMMESTDKGREVRNYFIECEKELRNIKTSPLESILDISDPGSLFKALEKTIEAGKVLYAENKVLTIENKELKSELKYTNNKLDGFLEANKDRRSKKEMSASIVSNVRLLAKQKFNENYRAAYNHIYDKFKAMHNITAKVNMDYLRKNNDYLAEVLEITISELD